MATDVSVVRVFTDSEGNFGNPLGVVDASTVAPADRQALATQLGYSETIFVDLPASGSATASARIFTPTTELPFAGHPTVGLSWWLKDRAYRSAHCRCRRESSPSALRAISPPCAPAPTGRPSSSSATSHPPGTSRMRSRMNTPR